MDLNDFELIKSDYYNQPGAIDPSAFRSQSFDDMMIDPEYGLSKAEPSTDADAPAPTEDNAPVPTPADVEMDEDDKDTDADDTDTDTEDEKDTHTWIIITSLLGAFAAVGVSLYILRK